MPLGFAALSPEETAFMPAAGAAGGIESGAVAERHHALNWLTRFAGADWDRVPTPT